MFLSLLSTPDIFESSVTTCMQTQKLLSRNTAVEVVKGHIKKHYGSEYLVSGVLEASFQVTLKDEENDDCGAEFSRINSEQLQTHFRRDLIDMLSKGMPMPKYNVVVRIAFEETHPGSLHFTTRDTHTDVVKAAFINHVTRKLNSKWKQQIKDGSLLCDKCNLVESVIVHLLLSNPMSSFSITIASCNLSRHCRQYDVL